MTKTMRLASPRLDSTPDQRRARAVGESGGPEVSASVGRSRVSAGAPLASKTLLILVVDDKEPLLHAIARRVEREGWKARTAATLQEALASVKEPLHGAIVDLRLNEDSRFAVIEALRAAQPRVRVLVLTGSNDRDDINRAQALGAEYCLKPLDVANLVPFLDRWSKLATGSVTGLVGDLATRQRLCGAHQRVLFTAAESTRCKAIAQKLGTSRRTSPRSSIAPAQRISKP